MYLDRNLDNTQRTYRAVTIVMFAVAVLTLVVRLLVRFLYDLPDLALDAIFSITVQVLLFLLLPFLVYKFVLKKSTREIAEFSSIKKIKWTYLVLASGVGVCAFIATIGVSSLWQGILIMTGYTPSGSASTYPEQFNVGFFLAEMALTALLPAICEEFLVRGGVLSAMRESHRYGVVIVIMGLVFGLFHQNVTQVFYTACFGALMAFLTIKLGSIFPAMIIHFVNNGLSVYLGYAEAYGWVGGNFFDIIYEGLNSNPMGVFGVYVLFVLLGAGLILLMLYMKSREKLAKQKEVILDSGFDQTNGRVVMMGAENKRFVEEIGMVKAVYGKAYTPDALYKPTKRDNAFLYGALAVTVISTVSTYIWGLF